MQFANIFAGTVYLSSGYRRTLRLDKEQFVIMLGSRLLALLAHYISAIDTKITRSSSSAFSLKIATQNRAGTKCSASRL